MPKIIIMIGLPASGKTTYVNEVLIPKGYQVVCADDLRLAHGHIFYGPLEPQIHGLVYTQVRALMHRGVNIVVDECTCRASYIARWIRLAEDMDYELEVHYLEVGLGECMERRAIQNPSFPLTVIRDKDILLTKEWPAIEAVLTNHTLITIDTDEEWPSYE